MFDLVLKKCKDCEIGVKFSHPFLESEREEI